MRPILARSITYISLIGILGFFYIIDTLLISRYYLQSPLSILQMTTYAIFALFIAFTFQPIKTELEQLTNTIFFKNKYDSQKLLHTLSEIMTSTIDLNGLLKTTLNTLIATMHISRGSFIIFKDDEIFSTVYEGYEDIQNFDKTLINNLFLYKRLIVFDDEQEGEIKDMMRKLDIVIFKPLIKDKNKIGVLLLGEKKSGEIYEKQDFDLLEIFVPEIMVAIENAKSYEEIKRFNITLSDGIDKATKDLQQANSRLMELDKMKDEFVSLASHELRTPLTAIKSYLALLSPPENNQLNDEQKLYADRAYISTERLINLVNDMLNVSRIDSGRINIFLEPIKLENLIQEVVDEVMQRSKELGVAISINKLIPCPYILVDKDKTKEVFFNLIGNSLKFTPKGGMITVSFKQSENTLETLVTDTGVGIEQQDLPRLFQKFGYIQSAYEAVNSNFPGTGLGLYMCKSLVEQQNGKITAASKGRNLGSTFTVVFPILSEEEVQKRLRNLSEKKTDSLGLIHYEI